MDEILIEEKRYVSSKRAAQITGYAKDYVGQLCREGRVPARLVGRSWYVLESAIQDHRFGKPGEEEETSAAMETSLNSEQEFPRYEAVEANILPSVNRLDDSAHTRAEESNVAPATENEPETGDSWKDWFDSAVLEPIQEFASTTVAPTEEIKEEPREENTEVDIPIRAIHHPELKIKIERTQSYAPIRPEASAVEWEEADLREGETRRRWGYQSSLKAAAIVLAVCAAATAILGSGYLDKYVGDIGVASVIAGITQVKK